MVQWTVLVAVVMLTAAAIDQSIDHSRPIDRQWVDRSLCKKLDKLVLIVPTMNVQYLVPSLWLWLLPNLVHIVAMAATKPVNMAATSLVTNVAIAATKHETTVATKHSTAILSLVCCVYGGCQLPKTQAARSYQAYSHRKVMYGCTQYAYGCYLVDRTSTSSTIARVLPQYVCMQHAYASFLHWHVVNSRTHGTILVPPCNIVPSQLKYQ